MATALTTATMMSTAYQSPLHLEVRRRRCHARSLESFASVSLGMPRRFHLRVSPIDSVASLMTAHHRRLDSG